MKKKLKKYKTIKIKMTDKMRKNHEFTKIKN